MKKIWRLRLLGGLSGGLACLCYDCTVLACGLSVRLGGDNGILACAGYGLLGCYGFLLAFFYLAGKRVRRAGCLLGDCVLGLLLCIGLLGRGYLLFLYAGVYCEGLFFNAHCDNVLDQAKDRLVSINLHDAVHIALGIARRGLDEVHACLSRVYLGILAKNHHEDCVKLRIQCLVIMRGEVDDTRFALLVRAVTQTRHLDIVAILGTYGSGKSFLTTQMGLYHVLEKGNQSKLLGIREPAGEGAPVGYLKGTLEDKTRNFFLPIEQQLKGGEFELEALRQRGQLDTNIPYYMKGTTYNDTIMLVDEAEDLSEAQIRLVGTRLGQNSRIFLSGDYGQSLVDRTANNPLVKMCNELRGEKSFGCIYLDEDVRSSASKLFAELFK